MINDNWNELTSELHWMATEMLHHIKTLRNDLENAYADKEFNSYAYDAMHSRLSDIRGYVRTIKSLIQQDFEEEE